VNFQDLWGLESWDGINPALKDAVDEFYDVTYEWPVDDGRITTVYGPTTPVLTPDGPSNKNHNGIDIAPSIPGTTGQDVKASAKGKVTSVETDNESGYGTTVTISHPDGNTSRYSHLDSTTVEVGQNVGQSDVVGTLGNTGKSQKAHLDFRVTDENGNYIDPLTLLPERPETITVEEKWVTTKEDGTLCNK